MEKKWFKMKVLGVLLVVFVFLKFLIVSFTITTKNPSYISRIPWDVIRSTIGGQNSWLTSFNDFGISLSPISRIPYFIFQYLSYLQTIIGLSILIGGIGLIKERKWALGLTLYTSLVIVILNCIDLIFCIFNVKMLKILKNPTTSIIEIMIKQYIGTIFLAFIVYYLTRPKVKELFK